MKKIVESYKRKLASEEGWVLKRGAQLRIALCYPNTYAIGMANLGFQAMYELFNNIPEVSCERVFLPDSVRRVRVSEGAVSTSRVGERGASPTIREDSNHRTGGSGYDRTHARANAPLIDELREYERTRTPLLSLESQTPVRDFDVI